MDSHRLQSQQAHQQLREFARKLPNKTKPQQTREDRRSCTGSESLSLALMAFQTSHKRSAPPHKTPENKFRTQTKIECFTESALRTNFQQPASRGFVAERY